MRHGLRAVRAMMVRPRLVSRQRIDTERLLLRPPVPGDAPTLARMLGPWDVARWLVRVPFPYAESDADAWIARAAEERSDGSGWPFVVTLRPHGTVIGTIDLTVEPDRTTGTLGYWIGEAYWGQGFGTEAARAMLAFAFSVLELRQVSAATLPNNERSARVLTKAGLVFRAMREETTEERGRVLVRHFVADRDAWTPRA